MTRRVALAALIATVVLIMSASPAAAHASLEAASPQADALLDEPPEAVELTFTEAVEAGLGGIRVFDPGGDRADGGEVDTAAAGTVLRTDVDAEEEGTYTVAWSVTSEDGHLIAGSFLFSVGGETDPATITEPSRSGVRLLGGIGRFLAFAGTMLVTGVVAFQLFVRRRPPTGALTRLALSAAAAAVVGVALTLLTHVALSSGRALSSTPSVLGDAVSSTRFGGLAFARLVFALSTVGLAAVWRRHPRALTMGALAIAALGLNTIPAVAGHAWTASPLGLAVAADIAHLLAVGIWAGGLVALLLHARGDDALQLTTRFSTMALIAVVIVVVTGSVSSYLQVRGLDGLETTYGRLLAIKVVVVLALIGVASLTRGLLRQGTHDNVFKLVATEVAIVAAVLGITTMLVNQPPARSAVVQPVSESVSMSGGEISTVQVQVEPARAGSNNIHLYFIGSDGLPQPVDAVELTVARADIPPRRVVITPVTPDHVSAYGASLPSGGTWTLTITAVRDGATSTASVEVEIR